MYLSYIDSNLAIDEMHHKRILHCTHAIHPNHSAAIQFIAECRMQMYVIESSLHRSSLLHCCYSLLWSTGNAAIKRRNRLALLCCVFIDLCRPTAQRHGTRS